MAQAALSALLPALARIDALLGAALAPEPPERPPAPAAPGPAAERLCRVLGLDAFDLDVLVLALAPELDRRYERIYGRLQEDPAARRPTVELALRLLCADAVERVERRARFAPDAPLVRHGAIALDGPSLLAAAITPDEQVVRLLLGRPELDARLRDVARF